MDDYRAFLLVAVGGGIGASLRFATQLAVTPLFPHFPWAVQIVNVVGSFAIGLLLPLCERIGPWARPFVVTGVLGGLTTMSSFAMDVVGLVEQRRFGAAVACWLGGAVVTLLACAGGLFVAARV